MKKRKWFFIVGMCILVIWLSACAKTTNEEDSANESPQQQETETEELNDFEENANDEREEQRFINIQEDDSITALVNKYNHLDENYVPEDLVTVSVPTVLENPEVKQLRQEAADALFTMFEKAKESDIYLHARSGYRSYQTQVHLFNSYVEKHGEEAANRYSARPGHSEHQTGLVMDVTSESVNFQLTSEFGETVEGKWLSEHAHEFGFIIRYPEGMEEITGYIYEPWHIRYLGIDLATEVYESGLTYEEFLVEEGMIHEVNAEANRSESSES